MRGRQARAAQPLQQMRGTVLTWAVVASVPMTDAWLTLLARTHPGSPAPPAALRRLPVPPPSLETCSRAHGLDSEHALLCWRLRS